MDQAFNSLDAQREACEAYIASQKLEGWELIDRPFDDGGISGGHLDRPALQRLMQDVDDKQVDQIVVYKIDRLTRSLADFARLVDRLDAAEASFVSVTQSFNTATSMGRLTLNLLLSFAQFEREVTAERIRDKIAASKRRGLWMGGNVPLGYDADGRTLKINEGEATLIRTLYDLYETHAALNIVTEEAARLGIRSRRRQTKSGDWRGGNILLRGHIHYILTNPIYAGRIPHKGQIFEGQHPAIIEPERWQRVQDQLSANSPKQKEPHPHKTSPSPLVGKLFDERGERLSPSHTRKRGRRYRYYISRGYATGRKDSLKGKEWRLPAERLERFVAQAIRTHLSGSIGGDLIPNVAVEIIQRLQDLKDSDPLPLLGFLRWATIGEGALALELDGQALGAELEVRQGDINSEQLSFEVPFIQRRCGAEARFVMSGSLATTDPALIANIARANAWLDRVRLGETFDEIAKTESTTKKRVQQTLKFAFLAPDVVRDILAGKQPQGLTSTWIATHAIPVEWTDQRALIATL
ncbi:DNA-invertase hin [Aliiroseovarius pelagivivens]|uniref:DNA-invertase hin n=1 Tax=Aliiroseovarius pelagivivens TaxID=1639690 RepID=A0A2R8AIZ5_9RHOB|nr:DNA-invertase hin [Aliiroseovarius pelagivivens]